jgi:YHS domain-containing protein
MSLLRKSACAVVMLGFVAGCNDDTATTTTATPTPSNTPSTNLPPAPSKPVVPSPGGGAPTAKDAASKEMQPPPPGPADAKKAGESPKLEGPKGEAGKGDSAAAKLSTDEVAAIKELPAAEQETALKQAVCPVSGHNLGEMGKPVKVSAEGRTFYLCCEDCQEKVKTDAKGVIAKLDARAKK